MTAALVGAPSAVGATATTGFAVFDTETTGFGNSDRVIEIGVVLLNHRLEVEREWATLVNPNRDVGPSWVHRLTARELRQAPSFNSIVPELLEVLHRRVIVAHNLAFDRRLMNNDFARVGTIALPQGICTMRLCGGASLKDACSNAGVVLTNQHEALADARATAMLFKRIWHQTSEVNRIRTLGEVSPVLGKQRACSGSVAVRRGAVPLRRKLPKSDLTRAELNDACVVFTGQSNLVHAASGRPMSRTLATDLATAERIEVVSDMSIPVDYLVCSDVDSVSQKARHARRRRIPIISEQAFWDALGIATQPR